MSNVDHPNHYNQTRIECIDVVENMDFCTGSAMKYLWRHEHKGKPIEDLRKAIWYIQRRIEYIKRQHNENNHRTGI